ncbi:LON peptidase substrate-binding domain-containing protein [Paracraurococcus lichenis]|uniref:LON peptidase substrate-binding domain-containing protein n=1 Tax=Paracraurococcus lichenis TaxID=3064888 RepID=A0ABT9E147_9PROT|nr:LON peptidase substrate-binding domain-containing protein [Paracraurococcus sp. LOR1-02]MDO9709863.1 LON peptidase substrate-binding domain-containing protein [Paracraurococcus sp. LOR1-02]
MAAFHPSLADLPAEIAVFPLSGALLLPGGRLPLNIFEPRYLAMTQDSLAGGRMFGMIQPEPGAPRGPAGPGLYRIGCLGRLSSFAETEDGRLLITLTGVIRFRVAEELEMRRGYRRVRADYAGFEADLDLSERPAGIDRVALLGALRPFFRARGIEANWEAIEQTSDQLLVLTLAMVCPFEVREKQALLEAPTPEERAAMLVALLEIGAHPEPGMGDLPPDRRPS